MTSQDHTYGATQGGPEADSDNPSLKACLRTIATSISRGDVYFLEGMQQMFVAAALSGLSPASALREVEDARLEQEHAGGTPEQHQADSGEDLLKTRLHAITSSISRGDINFIEGMQQMFLAAALSGLSHDSALGEVEEAILQM